MICLVMGFDLEKHRVGGPCGRPTKAGTPCKGHRNPFMLGCKQHCSKDETALGELLSEVHWSAWREGSKNARDLADETNRMLRDQIKELTAEADKSRRKFRDNSGQLVEVDGYAYRWTGPGELTVGDEVMLPPTWVDNIRGGGTKKGTVNALGSTWEGAHTNILRRA